MSTFLCRTVKLFPIFLCSHFLKILFIYLAALGLGLCMSFYSSFGVGATLQLQCVVFSLRWLYLLWSMGSRHEGFSICSTWASSCSSQPLEHRLNSCGTRA